MTACVALLRAVNLGGHGKVAMSALRELVAGLGFGNARTLLQSGNVVFESPKSGAAVAKALEAAAAEQLGLNTDFLVCSAKEWDAVIADNPFAAEAKRAPAFLVVVVLQDAPTAKRVRALQAAITGPERVAAEGRQLYAAFPNGQGRSKLTLGLIEKMLETRGTARNWNTVLKLQRMLQQEH